MILNTGSGSEMCDIMSCDESHTVYMPVETTISSLGQLVTCTSRPASKIQCISPRVSSSPTASPTPSNSEGLISIAPSTTATHTASPSVTPTPTVTATISTSPTPSTSPLCHLITGPVLNEFIVDALAGVIDRDTTVELRGTPGETFTGHITFLRYSTQIYVDQTNSVSGTFDSNGLLLATIPDGTHPTFTIVLSTAFMGSVNDVLDANNDGAVDDISIFGTVLDAIGIPLDDGAEETHTIGSGLGGVDFKFFAGIYLVFRDSCFGRLYAASSLPAILDSNLVTYPSSDFTDGSPFDITIGTVNAGLSPNVS